MGGGLATMGNNYTYMSKITNTPFMKVLGVPNKDHGGQ